MVGPTAVMALALLGRGAIAQAMVDGVDAAEIPTALPNLPVVAASSVLVPGQVKLNLSDPAALEDFKRQWFEKAQRAATDIRACPISCSSAGPDSIGWGLYPDAARMAACNETVLFSMAIDTDLEPTALRACTADLAAATSPPNNSSSETCAPVLQSEVSLPLRIASTGLSASHAAKAGFASAIRQISNHASGIAPSCQTNLILFAQAGKSVVGLYVGGQVHRQQGFAADLLAAVLAHVETPGIVSESLVVELCDPDAEYGADYAAGVVLDSNGDVQKVQQSVRRWANSSCLAAGASGGDVLPKKLTFLVPTPSSALLAHGHGNLNGTNLNGTPSALRTRDTTSWRALLHGPHGLARRQNYCSNAKTVVAGNTCETIADKRCTISLATFKSYNPGIDCKDLQEGQKVCCTPGVAPPPDPPVPAPDPYCTNWKTVAAGQSCEYMADKRCTVSLSTFKSRNPQLNCNSLRQGQTFCCNEGRVPPENECSNHKTVNADDTCVHMADKRCTISIAKFVLLNPHLDCLGTGLKIGEPFCCNDGRVPPPGPPPKADGTCTTATVANGDSCASLASKCGIGGDYVTVFNPQEGFCASLERGQVFCCGRGKLPDLRPKKNADGSCFVYTTRADDTCNVLAATYQLTKSEINKFNLNTWSWNGCSNPWSNVKICLSEGSPPLPAPVAEASCGPTVPGTSRPTDGTPLAELNQCPLNVCCNKFGNCGLTKDFCEVTKSETGAPGTSTCISNCGNEIISGPRVSNPINIAYFGAWNGNRPCLRMRVDHIDKSKYTHIHFAFADITPNTFQVDISKVADQFNYFKAMTGIKKIISFGGWDFSTLEPTYRILRDAVKPENLDTFSKNLVNFVRDHNLDGVDLDWEYPGAPDIPGIPEADPNEGWNYAFLLASLKNNLPAGKSVSLALPASYWYLRAFPIEVIAPIVDYVVYMTYDFHGQWDVGNQWTMEGCPEGNCLRSHVNITETEGALSMITKAGMPSSKVIVGITSYGRSFQMAQPGCRGPMCRFTGTNRVSHATPGRCTGTKGYISDAEIREIIATNPTAFSWNDQWSDYLVYNNVDWVAYMGAGSKALRQDRYWNLGMGGTSDWAVDLQSFENDEGFYNAEPEVAETCGDRPFASLEAIEEAKGSIPDHCMNGYILETLSAILKQGLEDYDAIMRTDYDRKFGFFVRAVKETWNHHLMKFFYDDSVDKDDWYNCYIVGSNNKITCNSGAVSIRMEVKDEARFADHLFKSFNISYEDTEPGELPRNLAGCLTLSTGTNFGPGCVLPNTAGTTASGVRLLKKSLVIPNPKTEIEAALSNLRRMVPFLKETGEDDRLGWLQDVSAVDVIESTAGPVFMVHDSIDNLKQVYDIGEELEEEEAKRKRDNIIAWSLSAFLLVLPGVGAGLATFARFARLGQIVSSAAYPGTLALNTWQVVNDPENIFMAVFFLVVDLIPGVGLTTKGTWGAAAKARARMTPADLALLGPRTQAGIAKAGALARACRR